MQNKRNLFAQVKRTNAFHNQSSVKKQVKVDIDIKPKKNVLRESGQTSFVDAMKKLANTKPKNEYNE